MSNDNNGKLRVLIVTENFLPKVDGVTRTLARLLEHLRDQGHEALLLGPANQIHSYAGHSICGAQVCIPLWFYPGLGLNFFRREFMRKAQAFDPDVIHYVDPIWLSAQAQPIFEYALPDCAAIASYHTNLARYASDYGFSWLVETMWTLQRRLHGRCMATFCPSPSTRTMLLANGFDTVRLWPRGIDTSSFSPRYRSAALRARWLSESTDEAMRSVASSTEDIVITYVGRLSTEKNIDLLMQAFTCLNKRLFAEGSGQPQCHLVLVGEGPARSRLERQSKGLNVTFTGYQNGQALAECYASSDIFAFPSHSETFGNVVLEAMASGLPVVGLHAEGICDLVDSGKTGYLLDLQTLPDARVPKGSCIPENCQTLFQTDSASFKLAVEKYADLLAIVVMDARLRRSLANEAVAYAASRNWNDAMDCLLSGYREAAQITRSRKAEKLFSALSRVSSTASLVDVKIEDPPASRPNNAEALEASGQSSARLLFGRPPLKTLLRRSTRRALRESISDRLRSSLGQEVVLVGRAKDTPRLLPTLSVKAMFVLIIMLLCILCGAILGSPSVHIGVAQFGRHFINW